jgi:alanine-glyoxylate transaminase/serine-glyoxylate transaminase/serine-pyruvate transaminase
MEPVNKMTERAAPGRKPGRHFFANPGPTNIPDSVLRAMDRNSLDFMEADFLEIYDQARAGLKRILFTEHEVFFYAGSGHAGWEASMVNLFSAGDKVLMIGGGYFSGTWAALSRAHGIDVEKLDVDWHEGVKLSALQARLEADKAHEIKAVCVVHNETSTSVVLPLREIRAVLDEVKHPALYLCDTISSLGCFAFKMDEWGVDVVVGGSQKGLMLPTGMAFSAVGPKALEAHKKATLPRFYFDWTAMLARRFRSFTGSAPIVPFFGLAESVRLLELEGIENVWARHHRLAEAVRAAGRVWGGNQGPTLYCRDPNRYSDSVTTFEVPEGHDADALRKVLLDRYNVSTGGGLGELNGRVFRIGHMGDLNEAMILGTLATVEIAMGEVGMPHSKGGIMAAIEALAK